MAGPVVVEVAAVSPEAVQLQAMVEACGRAVGEAHCVLARQAPEPPYAAVAIVTWQGEGRVRVEVGEARGEHSQWRSRDLVFQTTDVEIERWRAIGFVVGTLASAARAAAEEPREDTSAPAPPPPAPPPPASPPAPAPAVPAASPPPLERLGFLHLGWFAGDGLDSQLERNGAWLRLGLRPARLPLISFVSLGYSTATRAEHALSASWLDAGLGLGVVLLEDELLTLDLGAELGAERFSAEAAQAFVGSSARARWVGVARVRPELAWYWSSIVGAAAFAEASLRGGQTEVRVAEQHVGQTATFGYAFGFGLSLRAPR